MRDNTPLNAYRYALYYAPAPDEPLAELGRQWLGRDVHDDARHPRPAVSGVPDARMDAIVADACRYGLHATLKAPFRLAPGRDSTELRRALREFTVIRRNITVPRLVLSDSLGFPALIPAEPCPALNALADDCVRVFDLFRADLTPDELKRRQAAGLTAAQKDHVLHWGYPYIFQDFRFHMTLAGPMDDTGERQAVMTALREHFAPVLDKPLQIRSICLFMEPEKGRPFRLFCRDRFG
jgi:putative phosphonate metabolism protein